MLYKTDGPLSWPYNLFAELEYLHNKHICKKKEDFKNNWDETALPEVLNMLKENERICIIQRFQYSKYFKDIGIDLGGIKANSAFELCNRSLKSLMKLSSYLINDNTTNLEKLKKLDIYGLTDFLTSTVCAAYTYNSEIENGIRVVISKWLEKKSEQSSPNALDFSKMINQSLMSLHEQDKLNCA